MSETYKKAFGDLLKQMRLEKNISLRQFCLKNNIDPGNLSKMERGLLAPPSSREILSKYAKALSLKEKSPKWKEFFDKASACRGEIPIEILTNAEVVKQLPVLFRGLRGEKISKSSLSKIAQMIKRGGSK
jgi:transcriptional regulator with XRE-family HTH domain